MGEKNSLRVVFWAVVIGVVIIIYAWFFANFLEKNLLFLFMTFLSLFYVLLFVAYDYYLKSKELDEKLKIKDRREIRIGF